MFSFCLSLSLSLSLSVSWVTDGIFFCLTDAPPFTHWIVRQTLEEELNRRQSDLRQLTEAAGKLQERQVLECQALIGALTVRWQELQAQFQELQTTAEVAAVAAPVPPPPPPPHVDAVAAAAGVAAVMGGPDFVTRVNKLREAVSSVSRQLHCPPLNLKFYEQLAGQEDSIKVTVSLFESPEGHSSLNGVANGTFAFCCRSAQDLFQIPSNGKQFSLSKGLTAR